MGAINPHGQSKQEQLALRAVWEERPEVQDWSARVLAQVSSEHLEWDEAGLSRAFAIAREQGGNDLPESGIKATG